jgi:serine/threonine protein kinase
MTQQEINNSSMLKVGTILRGTYRIDSYLSSGGFGNTYVATNIEFDERIAIKEFFIKGVTQRDDNQTTVSVSNSENTNSFLEQKEKFKKEARRIRQLKNEHIVAVHDLFEENGTAYYVMDYVDGENLSEHLKRTGRAMTESEIRDILPQILEALKAVHNEGFCHLDIKPSNIMLEKDGKIKLIDFGASKQLGANGTLTTNAPTAFAQTPGYAPREQMEQNLDKIGPWTDIYALGATLYNLLTNNKPPLPSDIDDDMSEDKHLALPMPNVGEKMKQLVLRMMRTSRIQRPQTIQDVKDFEKEITSKVEPIVNIESSEMISENEETIVAKSAEKQQVESFNPQHNNPQPKYEARNIVKPEPENNAWKWILLWICFCIGTVWLINNCESNKIVTIGEIKEVKELEFLSPIGACKYTGPVDNYNRPNGVGEAYFDDGRYYKGPFDGGNLEGVNAYFKYPEGDTFTGEFRNNSFYKGKYTIAKDKSYFVGYYENGQPAGGSWYNKDGKVIQ